MDHLMLQTFPSAEAVSQSAAEVVLRCANEAISTNGKFTIALSGGSTPKRLYQILAETPFRENLEWQKIHLFWGDERSVPPDDPEANYCMTNEALLSKIQISPQNVHRLEAEREDRDQAAADYQQEIANVFEVDPNGPPPHFDLILLGMGPDGHTASLFPGTDALSVTDPTKWIVPNWVEQKDTWRMTFTRPMINAARRVMFLVAGPDKSDRLFEIWTGPQDPTRLPSQLIFPTSGNLLWYVDVAAVEKLTAGMHKS